MTVFGNHRDRLLVVTFVVAITFLVSVCQALQGSALEEARLHRENLVRKYLKKLKKEDGAIKLVGGRGDFEGELIRKCVASFKANNSS